MWGAGCSQRRTETLKDFGVRVLIFVLTSVIFEASKHRKYLVVID
jgi:hypothetical protein